jgi:hypothetical protein
MLLVIMRRLTFCTKILAFSLVLVLLTVRLGSFSDETFVYPIQDVIFQTAHISAEDAKHKPSCLKLKRASGEAFCSAVHLPLEFLPHETRLTPCFPYQALPEVYLDIFIPPDEQA